MLTIDVEKTGQVAVVNCAGRIVRGEEVSTLKNAVVSEKNIRVIVLDLSEVTMLDAGGLTALVVLHEWAINRGIRMQIVNPTKFVCDVLKLTGLNAVFEVSTFDYALWLLSGMECARYAAVC
jgi:anti-anti-sigma factor